MNNATEPIRVLKDIKATIKRHAGELEEKRKEIKLSATEKKEIKQTRSTSAAC